MENTLIENFVWNYAHCCALFPNATHAFDNESFIAPELAKVIKNHSLEDSKNNVHVQVSDLWVGLLSRLFLFLDQARDNPNLIEGRHLNERQLLNLKALYALIAKANEKSPALINNINAMSIISERENMLANLAGLGG